MRRKFVLVCTSHTLDRLTILDQVFLIQFVNYASQHCKIFISSPMLAVIISDVICEAHNFAP